VVALITLVGWTLSRLIDRAVSRARDRAMTTGQLGAGTLLLLGRRVVKVLLVTTMLLAILGSLGFRITPLLTGLGIGGIALALAAQKTLENFIGGVSVLSDQVIRVGDLCRFGDQLGHIEDVGLRSTRVRTLERTELSIPNGAVATMNVENLSMRDKILFKATFGLRYETTADQLRYVLAEVRRILYSHPLVEQDSARFRLAGFGSSSLDLELFTYLQTPDFGHYSGVKEDILLRIMDAVHSAGAQFAFPSQTVYLTRDRGTDSEKEAKAARTIAQWREEKQFPFPDFAPEARAAMRGTIVWPPSDSAVAPLATAR
jgi:MscS family membrane protein